MTLKNTNQGGQAQSDGRIRCRHDTRDRLPNRQDSRFPHLQRVIELGVKAAGMVKRTVAAASVRNRSCRAEGMVPSLDKGSEITPLPELAASSASVSSIFPEDGSSSVDSSSCHEQDKKPKNAMNSIMEDSLSPSPPPAFCSVAYAEGDRLQSERYKLGAGVEYIREDDLEGCFYALGGLARDLVRHVKDVLRGPPEDLRRPIAVKVTVEYTVTAVHKRI